MGLPPIYCDLRFDEFISIVEHSQICIDRIMWIILFPEFYMIS